MFVKKHLAAVFSLVLICSLLAACGGDNSASTKTTSSTSAATPTTATASGSTAGSTGSSASGSTVGSTGSISGTTAGSTGSTSDTTAGSTGSTGSSGSGSTLMQVVQSTYYVSSDTKQGHAIGIVKNISGNDLFAPTVKVNLLDGSGNSLASDSSISFDNMLIPSGAQAGFDISFNTPPAAVAKMDFSFDGQAYTSDMQPAPDRNLVASGDSMSSTGMGNMLVTSTVTNNSSKAANNVFAIVAFLDDAGNVLDVSELVVGTDGTIPAGGTAKSMIGSTRSGITPTKYLLFVAGSEQ